MKKKMRKLFDIWQGHQITDEEIYNAKHGDFPIITSHNDIKGYASKPFVTDAPCITMPSKGVVNRLYLQTKPFDANNTIALIPKNRDEIDLEYFILTQTKHITSHITSTNTNNYLNKNILKDVEIVYPDHPIQIKIKNRHKDLLELKESIEKLVGLLSRQISKSVSADGDNVVMNNVFHLTVGSDDNMTEEYAYNNKGDIPIYSGASGNDGIFRYTERVDYDFKDFITWSISGKAGSMFLRNGKCCLTRDCGIMWPRKPKEINLEWFALTQESLLKDFAIGRGGLGRLKKILIIQYSFFLPKRGVQDAIVKEYRKLIDIKNLLESQLSKINEIVGMDICV